MSVSGLPLQLTVPSDDRFRPIVLTMARRVAESVGFSAGDATAIGEELARQSAGAFKERPGGDSALDFVFEIAGPALRLRCRCGAARIEVLRTLPGA